MLVLTLKEDQMLHIGNNTTLKFERRGDPILRRCGISDYKKSVSVAIDAPEDLVVLREELTEQPHATY